MSECSGSDTVFIALPSAHFREVRIECHLTKRPFFFSFFSSLPNLSGTDGDVPLSSD